MSHRDLASAWLLALSAACAAAPRPADPAARAGCLSPTGALADTLYVVDRLSDASPPVPLRADLAPYPPDAGGEYRVRFRGRHYIASGKPVRVGTVAGSTIGLVRVGTAGAIPVFLPADEVDGIDTVPVRVYAPITYDCVFLPYALPQDFRG